MKTEISIHNYEQWFIDFIDGNLSDANILILQFFLEKNPLLKVEFEEMKSFVLPLDNIIFEQKSELKKRDDNFVVNDSNFDEIAFSYIEGNINSFDKICFQKQLEENVYFSNEFEFWKKTIIKSELSIEYPNKNSLKKRSGILFFKNYKTVYSSVAAILLLFFGLYVVYNTESSNLTKSISFNSFPDIRIKFSNIEKEKNAGNDKLYKKISKNIVQKDTISNQIVESVVIKDNEVGLSTIKDSVLNQKVKIEKDEEYYKVKTIVLGTVSIPEKETDSIQSIRFSTQTSFKEKVSKMKQRIVVFLDNMAYEKFNIQTHFNQYGELENIAYNSERFEFSKPVK